MEKSPDGDDVTSIDAGTLLFDAGTLLFDADNLRGEKKKKNAFFIP